MEEEEALHQLKLKQIGEVEPIANSSAKKEQGEWAFAGRPKINRSPARKSSSSPEINRMGSYNASVASPAIAQPRTSFVIDLSNEENLQDEQASKKRKQMSPPPISFPAAKGSNSFDLLMSQTKIMTRLKDENPNTKRELKTAIEVVASSVKRIRDAELKKEEQRHAEIAKLKLRLADLEAKLRRGDTTNTVQQNVCCQVGDSLCEFGDPVDWRERIESADNPEMLAQLLDLSWPEDCYRNTNLTTVYPLAATTDVALIVLQEESDMKGALHRRVKASFPQLGPQEDEDGSLVAIVQSLRSTRKGVETTTATHFCRITTKTGGDQGVVEALQDIKSYMERENRNLVTVPKITGIDAFRTRKLAEWVLRGTDIKLSISSPPGKPDIQPKAAIPGASVPREVPKKEPTAKKVLVLQDRTKSYKEILAEFKSKVNVADGQIKTLRRSNEGDLIVTLEEKNDASVCEDITAAMGSTKVRLQRKPGVVLHIKDLDALASKKELQEALLAEIGSEEDLRISDLRPMFGETQAATAVVSSEAAKKLLSTGRIRVGMVLCRIIKRENPETCFRCWMPGHKASTCSMKDRSSLCKRCGLEGHLARNCTNERSCALCNQKGHEANSIKCPILQKSLKGKDMGNSSTTKASREVYPRQ